MTHDTSADVEIILGNSNKKFSGVTSTMLQVLSVQSKSVNIAVLGKHHLPDSANAVSFRQAVSICRKPLKSGLPRVFHARRNDEMIQGLLLRLFCGSKVRLVFTSTAQRPKTWITRWLMSKMDGLLTTCSAAHQYMTLPADRVIPHGIDVDQMRSAANVHSYELPGLLNVGIFGRVRHQKGVDLFVEALIALLPSYPDWGGVIVGEVTPSQQSFVDDLTRKISDAGLTDRVRILGKVDFQDIPHLFRSVDIVTSLSRNEGFGLTVLEAMSVSKPVIATRAGAWPDIIDSGKDGLLIDVEDLDQLKASLEQLMRSAEQRQSMGAYAASKIDRQYTIEREASELLSYYQSVQQR
ncbi:glycosyltransferase family 4 protein [Reinekea marinisedimentorum]|uniref:Mannosyltransferase n=1 Tax=Reinekea marinisedimentorum TaxID=230495 RepID=A0A4V2UIV5_9GAMM|nr:glycosyltransferase family 4 protein [Reinekea marinisedimentorum]TCS37640.1 mannosyltransferase [Reinekea marinisedimentorum]